MSERSCQKKHISGMAFPLGWPPLRSTRQRLAKTYKDSKLSGGTADFPRGRHCLRDVPDGESCWPDVLRQPDDHMAPRSLERPAVARGNTGLKPESHNHQQQGSQKGLPRTKLLDKPQPRVVGRLQQLASALSPFCWEGSAVRDYRGQE